jgi:hypothetical protein
MIHRWHRGAEIRAGAAGTRLEENMALEAIINQKDVYRVVLEEYPEGV